MKNLVNRLQESGLIFKTLNPIDIKREFNSRKRIKLYLGIDMKNYFASIIEIKKKSRIVQKEAKELMEFHKKLEQYNNSIIKKKYIHIQAPICSKAIELFKREGWTIL